MISFSNTFLTGNSTLVSEFNTKVFNSQSYNSLDVLAVTSQKKLLSPKFKEHSSLEKNSMSYVRRNKQRSIIVAASQASYSSQQTILNENLNKSDDNLEEWANLESDIDYMTRTVRLVQWYPGHIAKAERQLKEELKWVDVVIEVRDARIPLSTTHPEIDEWIGERKKIVVLNREDMISKSDRDEWIKYYALKNITVSFTNGRDGDGILKLLRKAASVGKEINAKRKTKGLLPRAVRAAVIGYPNVGKSAIINRLMRRKLCPSAPRPGVTRQLRWVRIGENLDLLDSPGVLPMRIANQSYAAKLAICNDIGEAAYAVSGVASILIEILVRLPSAGSHVLETRYKLRFDGSNGEQYLESLADKLFHGDVDQASHRVLKDFRRGSFGWFAIERPYSLIDNV